MFTWIRHKAVLVLGCLLVAVALAACGGGPSEAEIDATVEARVELAKASFTPQEIVKEVIVEKIVVVTATPTSAPSTEVQNHRWRS